jgi:hypothetical protein
LLEPAFPETRLRSLGSLIRRHSPLAALFSAALEVKRPQKIDCGFRNPLLLGLAIWFSKTEPLVLLRDFCYRSSLLLAGFVSTSGAAASISVRIRRQLLRFASCGLLFDFAGAVQ